MPVTKPDRSSGKVLCRFEEKDKRYEDWEKSKKSKFKSQCFSLIPQGRRMHLIASSSLRAVSFGCRGKWTCDPVCFPELGLWVYIKIKKKKNFLLVLIRHFCVPETPYLISSSSVLCGEYYCDVSFVCLDVQSETQRVSCSGSQLTRVGARI